MKKIQNFTNKYRMLLSVVLILSIATPVFANSFVDKIKEFFTGKQTLIQQEANNTTTIGDQTTNLGNTTIAGSVGGDTDIKVNTDIIKDFLGITSIVNFFSPLVKANQERIDFESKTVIDLKAFTKEIIETQAKANQEFVKNLVKDIIANKPIIQILNGGSPPVPFQITSGESTPIIVKNDILQQLSLLQAIGSTSRDYTSILNTTNQILQNLVNSNQATSTAPVVPLDYVSAILANSVNTPNTDLEFTSIVGGIFNSNGVFILEADKTYELVALINVTGSANQNAFFEYAWVDANNIQINGSIVGLSVPSSSINNWSNSIAYLVITPVSDIAIHLRSTVVNHITGADTNRSFVSIKQIK